MNWTTQDDALLAFQIIFVASDNNGATSMMPWEGSDGEVVFGEYPGIQQEIADQFGGAGTF